MKIFPEKFTAALVSPSSLCDRQTVEEGKAFLEKHGVQVKLMPHLFSGGSLAHLSAPDELRAADINAALADEEVDIIWAVRGGCGAMRILDKIEWELFRQRKLFFAGFSDITAIHFAMESKGAGCRLVAPTMKFLCQGDENVTLASLGDAIAGEGVSMELPALNPGEVSAPLLPGNLMVAAALCGSSYFPDTAGKIVLLEEVGEAAYRIERALTQLKLAGAFRQCAAVVFGNFTGCGDAGEVMAVLKDFAGSVDFPVFCGFAHGHELPFISVSGEQIFSIVPAL